MDESRVSFLKHLIASPSPSGFEQAAQQVIREEIKAYTDELRTDVHGNVIAALNPGGQPRIMLEAHTDELGFLVRYIDKQGFIYFAPLGGFDPSTLPGNRVYFHTANGPVLGVVGRKPAHLLSAEDRGKAPKISELFIDVGASSQEEALELVPLGTAGTRAAELETLHGDVVVSRALDDKSGIFTLVEALRRIYAQRDQLKAALFLVSAVQEEVGLRGARTSAYSVDPQIALVVDVTFTSDHPGTSKTEIGDIRLNGGPVISIGGNINPRVYRLLTTAAKEAGIAYQIDAQASSTYTDTDVIQISRAGVATGLVSIPCRYLHTGSEIASLKDIDQVAEVLARFVLSIDANTNIIP